MTQVSSSYEVTVLWILNMTSDHHLTCTRAKSSLAKFPEVSPFMSSSRLFLNTDERIFLVQTQWSNSVQSSNLANQTSGQRHFHGWEEPRQSAHDFWVTHSNQSQHIWSPLFECLGLFALTLRVDLLDFHQLVVAAWAQNLNQRFLVCS